jgi:hypothetical protein
MSASSGIQAVRSSASVTRAIQIWSVMIEHVCRRSASGRTLRAGNVGFNTAANHNTVLDAALTQIPDEHRRGKPILVPAVGWLRLPTRGEGSPNTRGRAIR